VLRIIKMIALQPILKKSNLVYYNAKGLATGLYIKNERPFDLSFFSLLNNSR
jgi:hypothetical protein